MSWVFKGIALMTLAAGGFYGLHVTDSDRIIVERLMRAADGTERKTDVLGTSVGERSGTRQLAAATGDAAAGDQGPAAASKAFAVRPGGAESPTLAATGTRLDDIAAGHVRMAQAPGGSAGTAGQPTTQPSQPERRPVVDDARRRLASSIQAELKRVGCYTGEIDGDWGQASQRAMKAFNERVKATLPIDQPDYILLTLLQGHTTIACGATCPRGEVDAGDGSCKPRAVVADNRLRATPPEPAPWAQSLAQIAGAQSGSSASEADAQRARLAAEQDRLRLKNEAEARLQDAARQAAEARAKAETARAEAATVAQRKADAEKALADAERARIAAAEERRRQQTAEMEARAEAERLSRIAEAEKARIAAEASRRQELDALAARTAETKRPPAVASDNGEPERKVATSAPDAEPQARRNSEKATNSARAKTELRNEAAAAPKFVARFVPPPTYRVGRLPPAPVAVARPVQRPVTRVFFAAPPRGTGTIFNHVSRHSP